METVPNSPEAAPTISLENVVAVAMELPNTELATTVEVEQKSGSSEAAQPIARRGRGRPKGTGKLQTSFGGLSAVTAGANFTPYIMIVHEGEDVTNKILQFNEKFSMSTCVLSAVGSVCSVDLSLAGIESSIRYEGQFDIVYLSGLHMLGRNGEIITVLSIKLVDPHGKVFGGKVTGPMIAAEPVQIIMGAFVHEMKKKKTVGCGCSSLQSIQENEAENGDVEAADIVNEEISEMPKSFPAADETRVPSSNGVGEGDVNAAQNENDQDCVDLENI